MKNNKNAISLLLEGTDALAAINAIVKAASEYGRILQEETTKRHRITAEKEVRLEEIRVKRDCFMAYLDRTFDERKEIFQNMFEALDQALVSDDKPGAVSDVINRIVDLAKTSPLDRFRNIENVKGFLDDPDAEITY